MISKLNCCTNTCAHCKELDQTIVHLIQEHQKFIEAMVTKFDLMQTVVISLAESADKQTRLAEIQLELKKLENQQ